MEERRSTATTPGWYPDPARRFEFRYHNGLTWTGDVAVSGKRYVDHAPIVPPPPQQFPPAGPDRGPRNGLATAALTCGIISAAIGWLPVVFVAGIVLAVLAIVFGAVGLRRSRVVGHGRGFAITGLVTGAVGIGAAAGGLGLTIWTLRVIDRYENPAAHSVLLDECAVSDSAAHVRGTLTNESPETADYTVVVRIRRSPSGVAIGTHRARLDDVPPGGAAPFRYDRRVTADDIDCEIVEVTGPLPFGIVPG